MGHLVNLSILLHSLHVHICPQLQYTTLGLVDKNITHSFSLNTLSMLITFFFINPINILITHTNYNIKRFYII